MRIRPERTDSQPPALCGAEGELVSIQIGVEPKLLEDLLEALAALPFPVNPQILNHLGDGFDVLVEFPAYAAQLEPVRAAAGEIGLEGDAVRVRSMLEELLPH